MKGMRIVVRCYVDGVMKPHISEHKEDVTDEIELEDAKVSIGESLDRSLQKWLEMTEDEDDS